MVENKVGRKKRNEPPKELIEFGTKLYNLRSAMNFSYSDLEKITETKYHHQISRASWSKYERGMSEPTLTNLRIMADLFHVSVDYLIGLTDKAYKEN